MLEGKEGQERLKVNGIHGWVKVEAKYRLLMATLGRHLHIDTHRKTTVFGEVKQESYSFENGVSAVVC